MLQALLGDGEDAGPVIYHLFLLAQLHEKPLIESLASRYVLFDGFSALPPSAASQSHSQAAACHPFFPASTAALPSSGLGNRSNKATEPKQIFLGIIIYFPNSFYLTLLSHSFVALHHDIAGTNTWEGVRDKDWEVIF